jgi:hypothetical protein
VEAAMPEIARFYGIIIKLFFIGSEHNPPHIHALYGEYMSSIAIETGKVVEGDLPGKALALVREWLDLHRDELMAMWQSQEFRKLPPLL